MGQQHRVRSKRRRRKAYIKRKRHTLRSTRRETLKPKSKKPATAVQ